MGNHYVPRKYLAGFCDSSRKIWTYDRLQKKLFLAALEKVANEKNFYSPEDEADLNRIAEAPANEILDKLRDGQSIADAEWEMVGYYIATLLCRVPGRRLEFAKMAPAVFGETVECVKAKIKEAGQSLGMSEAAISARIEEADALYRKHVDDPTPLIQETLRCPWPSETIFALIQGMTWRILKSSGPDSFLTSDNPVFYFECWGFGCPEAEISFPIASKFLLHGNRRQGKHGEVVPIPRKAIVEMNRRTVSRATRFIFNHRREDWIALANKVIDVRSLSRFV
jgi:hypothetical protein